MSTDDDVAAAVVQYILDHHPGTRAVVVSISSPKNGRPPYLSRLVKIPAMTADPGRPNVGRTDRGILQAIAAHDGEAPTGPEIADAMHIPEDKRPELRKRLSALRTNGLLGGKARDQGYPITPLGLAAIDD